jgi:hypothetical protein
MVRPSNLESHQRLGHRSFNEQVLESNKNSNKASYSTLFMAAMAFWASASWV